MKKIRCFLSAMLLLAVCAGGCSHISLRETPARPRRKTVRPIKPESVKKRISEPEELSLLAFKAERKMELWGKRKAGGWYYIKTFPIVAASGKAGPKTCQWDLQVPEGIYRIVRVNLRSQFHISFLLNYPNEYDRLKAAHDSRTMLGGDICIHGKDVSTGCIALGDRGIEELYRWVRKVGPGNVEVIIAPNDLRVDKPLDEGQMHITWVPELYKKLGRELLAYKPSRKGKEIILAIQKPLRTVIPRISQPSHTAPASGQAVPKLENPVRELCLLALKKEKRLEMWGKKNEGWTFLSSYLILSSTGKSGPKTDKWDLMVPEGIYRIAAYGSQGLLLTYPNAFDREKAALDGRTHLGDNIYIYGSFKKASSISIGDAALMEIRGWIRKTGAAQTKVVIAPADLRVKEPADEGQMNIPWVKELYAVLKGALNELQTTALAE
ncbi:MAG: L,D-transpeptidase family protein [Bacillota bacterium]